MARYGIGRTPNPSESSFPSPYLGGYDIEFTYGRALPPSDETCYPISSSSSSGYDGRGDFAGIPYPQPVQSAPAYRPQPQIFGGRGDNYGPTSRPMQPQNYGYRPAMNGSGVDNSICCRDSYLNPPSFRSANEYGGRDHYGYRKESDGGKYKFKPLDDYEEKKKKKKETLAWESEYGYGGRRIRYNEDMQDPIRSSYDEQEGTLKKRKKDKEDRVKVYQGQEMPRNYGYDMSNYHGQQRNQKQEFHIDESEEEWMRNRDKRRYRS